MADQQIANLEVQFGVDASRLQAGMNVAAKSFKSTAQQFGEMTDRMAASAPAMKASETALAGLLRVNEKTDFEIKQEVKSLDRLIDAYQMAGRNADHLVQQKERLVGQTLRTEDATNRAASASHRANLFMINFSRGVEDLKFGLPAVINNLEGIALGYEMMAKEAKAAEKSVSSVLLASLMSPAGMIALLNLVITTAFILGPTLKKAFNEGRVGAKALKKAVDEMLETPAGAEPRSFFGPANLAEAEKFLEIVEARADDAKATVKDLFGSLSGLGAVQGAALRDLLGLASEEEASALERYQIYKALKEQAEQIRVTMAAQAAAAEEMAKSLRDVAPTGSINDLNKALDEQQELYDSLKRSSNTYAADAERIAQKIRDLEVAISVSNVAMAGQTNSLAKNAALMEIFRTRADQMAVGAERTAYIIDAALIERMIEARQAIDDANTSLAKFGITSAFALGDAATGGFFNGLFGSFKGADADKARLALIELNKGFADLEDSLARGDISYEEFAIRNRMRMEEMDRAQRELALATRNNFELMAARIGNAFEGMAMAVRNAFKQIAQDFVTILVRRGIANLLAGVLTSGSSTFLGRAAAATFGAGSGGGFTPNASIAQRVSIAPVAAVVPSGDLEISLRRANVTNSRTGV